MSIVADFSLPRSELLLGDAPNDWSGRVQFEQFVPAASSPLPYVRVSGDAEAFAASARADPGVESVVEVDATPAWTRYRIEWTPIARREIRSLLGDVVVVEIVGSREWTVCLRFSAFDDVTAFREMVAQSDIPLELHRLREESRRGTDAVLTDLQRETLSVALRRGYFEVPRSATLSDLADELGVSKQAVSERLRRALSLLAADAVDEAAPTR